MIRFVLSSSSKQSRIVGRWNDSTILNNASKLACAFSQLKPRAFNNVAGVVFGAEDEAVSKRRTLTGGKNVAHGSKEKEGKTDDRNFFQTRQQKQHSLSIPGVDHVVVVASGKGGVGKSTVATNLALALSQHARVGLLDADIYGPSIHRMMNVSGKPNVSEEMNMMLPKSNYGVPVMSMGMIMDEDAPAIWRGPMVMSALDQMLRQVYWGELNILVVDMPPGTGDIHLSISQRVHVSGAVIVSTPQDIALIDARRAANMFKKVNVPILGIVENMSYYQCSKCGNIDYVFGHAGAKKTADEMQINFLGEVPLHIDIRETSDSGRPIAITNKDSPYAKPFYKIAENILQKLSTSQDTTTKQSQTPKIIIEDDE